MGVIMCKMTPFVITEDGEIDYLASGTMENVYQVDDQYFKFFENQVKELNGKRSQGIFASVFRAFTGSRCKTRRRQLMGIPQTPVTIGSTTPITVLNAPITPMNVPEVPVTTTPLAQVNTIQAEPAMLEPIEEVLMQQPGVDSQLGGSYITMCKHKMKVMFLFVAWTW